MSAHSQGTTSPHQVGVSHSTRRSEINDRRAADRSIAVDQHFALLRRCIADCGWTLEALGREMGLDKAYLHRLLNDPAKHREWKVAHTVALPDDVEALFKQRQAEAFGLIVVQPAATTEQAARDLISGFMGLLAPRLPQKTNGQLKVELR